MPEQKETAMPTRLSAALAFGLFLPFAAAPALAEGCHSDKVKMSCAEGAAWDEAKQMCAPKPSA